MKPLIVGENNPYSSNPVYALWPDPPHSAGGRLCNVILGMDIDAYCDTFDRVNLLSQAKWSVKEARTRAFELLDDTRHDFILLGAKVSRAFGMLFSPFQTACMRDYDTDTYYRFLVLPHPSGLCRVWNDPNSIQRTREAVAKFYPSCESMLGKTDGVCNKTRRSA